MDAFRARIAALESRIDARRAKSFSATCRATLNDDGKAVKTTPATPRISDIGADPTGGGAAARETEEARDARILREDAAALGIDMPAAPVQSIPAGPVVGPAPTAADRDESAAVGHVSAGSVVELAPAPASPSAGAGCSPVVELPPARGRRSVTADELAQRSAEAQRRLGMMRAESAQRDRDHATLRRLGFAPMFLREPSDGDGAPRAGPGADFFEDLDLVVNA